MISNPAASYARSIHPSSTTIRIARDTGLGTTCTYRGKHGSLRELIFNGGGLDQFPSQIHRPVIPGLPDPDALPRSATKFGGQYPTREEHNDHSCLVAIETNTNRVLAVTYISTYPREDTCAIAQVTLADGLLRTMH